MNTDYNPRKIRVLVLYSEMAGYFYSCLQHLAETLSAEVLVISREIQAASPYHPPETKGIRVVARDTLDATELETLSHDFDPHIVYVAGWMHSGYLKLCRELRKSRPVIMGMDNWWHGSLRQRLASLLYRRQLRRVCSHIWVAGLYQFEFAKRLGFSRDKILTGLYCADPSFEQACQRHHTTAEKKTLLFVGRLVQQKYVVPLAEAFLEVSDSDWQLKIVGNGPETSRIPRNRRVDVTPFLQPHLLRREVMHANAFCLPSVFDAWGVVLHEFALAGLPLIASDGVGAHTAFLRDGYNGFLFQSDNYKDLKRALRSLFELSDADRDTFGKRSQELGRCLNPDVWTTTLVSVLRRPSNQAE